MRKWIDLFENIAIPSFIERVNDDLVDEIMRTGKWVEHGAELEDRWDSGSYEGIIDDVPDDFWTKPYEEVKNTPEFRRCVVKALHLMADQAYEELVNGSKYENLPPLQKPLFCIAGSWVNLILPAHLASTGQ